MNQFGKARALVAIGAIALIAAACSSGGGATTAPSSSAPAESAPRPRARRRRRRESPSAASSLLRKIGYSNGGGVGNGFREEQVCTAKAQWASAAARSRR